MTIKVRCRAFALVLLGMGMMNAEGIEYKRDIPLWGIATLHVREGEDLTWATESVSGIDKIRARVESGGDINLPVAVHSMLGLFEQRKSSCEITIHNAGFLPWLWGDRNGITKYRLPRESFKYISGGDGENTGRFGFTPAA
ncbi:hypothetical protein FACS1894122_06400 [Alphaproteobacteria bacterium]|nr:hypothetical protein FACS1894122_06400 [Alphaproteobacteria bacterium]